MPTPTPELGLQKAIDSDDTANYLDTSLSNSLTTIDSLFNNVSGHTHGGAHQGAPIGSIPISAIPDGSITSAKIQDGTITGLDFADGAVTNIKLAANAVTTDKIADGTIQGADIAGNTITSDKIATFSSGPFTTDWFRCNTSGQGIFNTPANQGIAFDASGAFAYPSGDRLVTATAGQTLSGKTLTSPTINGGTLNSPSIGSPTLSGTVSGAPAWASGQTFPTLSVSGNVQAATFNGQSLPYSYTPTCHIQSGQVDMGNINNAQGTQQTVTFPQAFAGPPTVVVSHYLAGGQQSNFYVSSQAVTATNFQAHAQNASGSTSGCQIRWIAVYGTQ